MLGGGSERVVFRLLVEVDKLEASLLYESASAPPLALAHIEDVSFNLHVHPATLRLTASLGNLRAQDGALPEVGFILLLHTGFSACLLSADKVVDASASAPLKEQNYWYCKKCLYCVPEFCPMLMSRGRCVAQMLTG